VKIVDTVALVVEKDGRLLVERRKLSKETDPGKVAIPGGHVEDGESLEEACRRELYEELGLTCRGFNFIVSLPHRTGSEDQVVHYFSCCLLYTSPSPRDATLSRMPSSA